MDSIVIYKTDILSYLCSLNKRGRRRYGSIKDLLSTGQHNVSTVGLIDGSNVVMDDKRVSRHYKSVFDFRFNKDPLVKALKRLVPQEYEPYVKWVDDNHAFDVVEYNAGGFFVAHKDTKHNKRHYATLLIFPPAFDDFAHTGGELIITKQDGTQFVFESSKNTQWTFIAFPTDLLHECRVVHSGRRVVLKTELYYSSKFRPIYEEIIHNDYTIVDGHRNYIEEENLPVRDVGIHHLQSN
jgi:hypothetical protein